VLKHRPAYTNYKIYIVGNNKKIGIFLNIKRHLTDNHTTSLNKLEFCEFRAIAVCS